MNIQLNTNLIPTLFSGTYETRWGDYMGQEVEQEAESREVDYDEIEVNFHHDKLMDGVIVAYNNCTDELLEVWKPAGRAKTHQYSNWKRFCSRS